MAKLMREKTAFFRNLKDYLFNPDNGSILSYLSHDCPID